MFRTRRIYTFIKISFYICYDSLIFCPIIILNIAVSILAITEINNHTAIILSCNMSYDIQLLISRLAEQINISRTTIYTNSTKSDKLLNIDFNSSRFIILIIFYLLYVTMINSSSVRTDTSILMSSTKIEK